MQRIVVLGSTGSIGTQAIDLITKNRDRFEVVGLSAARQSERLRAQADLLGVNDVAILDSAAASDVQRLGRRVYTGDDAAEELVVSVDADVVLNGITGSVGLRPTLAALKAGRTLALADKESLIVGGPLVKAAARSGQIVPVDSEHSAIAQALRAGAGSEVRRLIVTTSGGPFRGMTRDQLLDVTPQQALNHPTWNMGRMVTTNSATLVNKGLEVIEAHLLFDVPFDRIDVVVHPQSYVHSMVEFIDGSTIAQVSVPDMRLPIALSLDWPNRVPDSVEPIDWTKAREWVFEPLDDEAFPAVTLARFVGENDGTLPAVYNAANEQAVEAFHAGRIGFLDIVDTIQRVVDNYVDTIGMPGSEHGDGLTLEAVFEAERWARRRADELVARI